MFVVNKQYIKKNLREFFFCCNGCFFVFYLPYNRYILELEKLFSFNKVSFISRSISVRKGSFFKGANMYYCFFNENDVYIILNRLIDKLKVFLELEIDLCAFVYKFQFLNFFDFDLFFSNSKIFIFNIINVISYIFFFIKLFFFKIFYLITVYIKKC